jgi:hypothetical protein
MDEPDLGPTLSAMHQSLRQQAEMILKLTCGLAAMIAVMKKRDPQFAKDYEDKYASLLNGESGKQILRDISAFDQMMKSGQA